MMRTLRIARMKKMGPPWSDVEAIRRCASNSTAEEITIDVDSECYRKLTGKPAKSRGVGDTVAKITSALGIPECGGCAKRRAALNSLFPFGSKPQP